MLKLSILLCVGVCISLSSAQQFQNLLYRPQQARPPTFIHPTYRPPPQKPLIRYVRDVSKEPWVNENDVTITDDHQTILPYFEIEMDPNSRHVRSLDSPSGKRSGHSQPTANKDTGATHPGYNRRHTRNIPRTPFVPSRPRPSPFNPKPNPRPLRIARDISFGNFPRKPTHHTVVIPNWNPNVKPKPHQIIRVRAN